MQQPDTQHNQDSNLASYLWLAGIAGVAAGIATLAYKRRETPWERARRRTIEAAVDAAETAREQVKPWMGVAAGAALSGAGLAYKMRRKPQGLELARKRAGEMAAASNKAIQPWMTLALTTAISAIAAARNPKKRRNAIDNMRDSAAPTVDKLAEAGASILRRIQNLTEESRKLYPSVKRLIA